MVEANIADMINAKRAAGPDIELEKLLTEKWYCPVCKERRTIMDTAINFIKPGSPMACRVCDEPGISPMQGNAILKFRRLLDKIEPFNRIGTA